VHDEPKSGPERSDVKGGDRTGAEPALGEVESAAASSVPVLTARLGDPSELIRQAENLAPEEIRNRTADALRGCANGKPGNLADVLSRIGMAPVEAVPALVDALRHENSYIRANAVYMLGKIGPAASDAIPILINRLGERDVGPSAAIALGEIGLAAIPALAEALGHSDSAVRRRAAFALGNMQPIAVEAVPDLINALQDLDDKVRANTAEALRNIERKASDLEPISSIAISLAVGAGVTAGKEVVSALVKDAYSKLKELVRSRYPKVSVDHLEQAPESKARRAVVEEELTAAGAGKDAELVAAAHRLVELAGIAAEVTGVKVERGNFTGDIEFAGVVAGAIGQMVGSGIFDLPIGGKITAGGDVSFDRDFVTDAATTRTIDANFFADRFVAGEMATLTITIRLPQNPARGRWQGRATFAPELGPIQIMLEAQGFTLVSELPPPFDVPKDSDTAPVAFEFRIEEATHRWLHIMLLQKGRSVGELIINDFSAVGQRAAQQITSSAVRSIAEADLMLVVRAAEGRVEACSPSDRASLDHIPMTGFKYPTIPFRELLADRLRALYDSRSDPAETARELQIVGVELAACLPTDLVKLLRRRDIQSVMLRHEDDFDFPLELCYLDDPDDPFFVGDRIAVCRWYLGVTSLPDIVSKRVRRVAFLKGSDEAFKADEILLNRLYPERTVTFAGRTDIVNKLFKTSDFDLIHFTGHCRQQDKASGGLELADGTFLRLIEIGQLESERAFAAAQPFVMLNACASAQPYLGLTQRGSFAHRFVTSRACAVVGTLWPVAGTVANEFVERFYTELASKPIGQALLAAKLALVRDDTGIRDGTDEVSRLRRLARQVAVRSYCLFANPDLRLVA
jgi:HEAT repeat protein